MLKMHSLDCFCGEVETEKEGAYGTKCKCFGIDEKEKVVTYDIAMIDLSKSEKLKEVV